MKVRYAYGTDIGRKRDQNEDAYLCREDLGLFLVADGMGGHNCGDVASKTAVEVVERLFDMAGDRGAAPERLLVEGVQLANKAIWEIASTMPQCSGMGTTITGLVLTGGSFSFVNVGDSRIYVLSGGSVEQLTVDHSLVEEQVSRGLITRSQARHSPKRNIITRALGVRNPVEVDVGSREAAAGETVLLCSDGLTTMLEDEEIASIVAARGDDMETAVADLVEKANERGGDDNITVVMLRF
ncbi:MAG TPA: Stp1/IreP family PP2C-type Ser/Thr phosphatase [Deltaproteobacteria bacterium]|nr:Stp1/IreP family PP2C-type Ser/Thr phosphatase [Deltaproteobacteria bacterium]